MICNVSRMRTPAFLLIAATVLCWAPLSASAEGPAPATVKSVLKLEPEIDCPSCEDNLKHTLVSAHGVQSADIDVLTNRIVVRYDPRNISLQALIGRIRVYGYTATEVGR